MGALAVDGALGGNLSRLVEQACGLGGAENLLERRARALGRLDDGGVLGVGAHDAARRDHALNRYGAVCGDDLAGPAAQGVSAHLYRADPNRCGGGKDDVPELLFVRLVADDLELVAGAALLHDDGHGVGVPGARGHEELDGAAEGLARAVVEVALELHDDVGSLGVVVAHRGEGNGRLHVGVLRALGHGPAPRAKKCLLGRGSLFDVGFACAI